MLESKTDAELVEELKAGNHSSLEELITRYSAKAFSLATRLTKNQEDAEEVLQDVFTTVFRKVQGFEGKSTFSSWLYRVTVNAALMKLRKNKQEQSVLLEDLLPDPANTTLTQNEECDSIDNIALRKQLLNFLEDAIKKLPEEYRPVFILRDIDGLTNREVAEILDLTTPAVKSRLHRSRIMLRKRLAKYIDELNEKNSGKKKSVCNY